MRINQHGDQTERTDSAGLPLRQVSIAVCCRPIQSVNPFSFISSAFLKSAIPVRIFRNPSVL